MPSITIDPHRCKQCGICIAFCPREVFGSDRAGGPVVERPDRCSACGLCVMRCPDLAVEVEGV
ncbi:MAG: ferredoxin family protein [Clostridia bacterium]|nr:ferredoxin family protein [Clostridia bacterium]